jgi:hypothetical protein
VSARAAAAAAAAYDNIESELLREELLATSAETPAEAFVKRLLNPSPASRSKTEELLREQLAASESRAATAEASLAASESRAVAAESRAANAEASLAASTTHKESALEIDLRERNAALEEDVVALRASSLFEDSVTSVEFKIKS